MSTCCRDKGKVRSLLRGDYYPRRHLRQNTKTTFCIAPDASSRIIRRCHAFRVVTHFRVPEQPQRFLWCHVFRLRLAVCDFSFRLKLITLEHWTRWLNLSLSRSSSRHSHRLRISFPHLSFVPSQTSVSLVQPESSNRRFPSRSKTATSSLTPPQGVERRPHTAYRSYRRFSMPKL